MTTQFDAIRAYRLSEYIWSPKINAYTYPNGVRVSERALYGAIKRYEKKLEEDLQSITTSLFRGDLSLANWQKEMGARVKKSHLELLKFGAGGTVRAWQENETNRHLKRFDYPALDKFGRDLQSGKLSKQQIRARVAQYAKSPKIAYERGRLGIKKETGQQYGRRLLGKTDLHCEDCLRYAGLGWQRLEDIILPGTNCQCGANCLCSIEVAAKLP